MSCFDIFDTGVLYKVINVKDFHMFAIENLIAWAIIKTGHYSQMVEQAVVFT